MARIDSLTNFLTDVATAIKDKKGDNTSIKASDFDTEITNLPSGGASTPTKGFVVDEWDSDGYATKITAVGFTELPTYAFSSTNLSNGSIFAKNLREVVLPSNMTKISNYCFNWNANLTTINGSTTELPNNITEIGDGAFYGCKALNIKTIPDGVKAIGKSTFYYSNIRQLSMKNVETVYGTDSYGPFRYSNLKYIWVGSTITNLERYSFATYKSSTTDAEPYDIYIDLPRATVKTFSGYNYRFANAQATSSADTFPRIICNDDEGFITKEEFDATTF